MLLWSGHAMMRLEEKLHLVAKDTDPEETPLILPEYLAGVAARTGGATTPCAGNHCITNPNETSALFDQRTFYNNSALKMEGELLPGKPTPQQLPI